MSNARELAELGGSYGQGGFVGMKNRVINGAFQVWQRGTTISSIAATGTTATYVADRWCLFPANTGWTAVAQVVQVSGGGLRVNCTTAAAYATTADVISLQQRIEGLNCYDLAGQQVTVSFKVKTNKTGNYGVVLYDGTAAAFGTPQSITVSSSGVETTYTLTFTAPSSITVDNADRLRLIFTLGANTARAGSYYPTGGSQVNLLDSTSNYFEIDEVQLEKGSTATSFDYRPYGTELALCQRYYYKVKAKDAASRLGMGWVTTTTTALVQTTFPVTMRTNPTSLEQSGTAGDYRIEYTNTAQTCSTVPIFTSADAWGAITIPAVSSGLTAGQGAFLRSINSNAYLAWSVEL